MSAVPKSDQAVLLREDREGICTLTMNRPQQMNLLTSEMLSALQDAFDSIKNEKQTRVIVLAATGKGFCAGHDLTEIKALNKQIEGLVRLAAPDLVALFGVGVELAGQFLVTAGDNADRIHSEGAFAKLCGVAPQPQHAARISNALLRRNRCCLISA